VVALAVIPEHWKQVRFDVHAAMMLSKPAFKAKPL
jgi:hypothetical protein